MDATELYGFIWEGNFRYSAVKSTTETPIFAENSPLEASLCPLESRGSPCLNSSSDFPLSMHVPWLISENTGAIGVVLLNSGSTGPQLLFSECHRQMMNPSVLNLQHRLVLELSVGLSFDQRQAQWRIYLFWQRLQALSARSCRSLARNLHSSGYTQSTCSQGGGPCEGFEKRRRTTTTSVRGV